MRNSPKITLRTCPSCGAALDSAAMTCHSCGGLIVVESIFSQLKLEIKYQIGNISQHLRDRKTFLWSLALCPIVILPPVLAIFLSFRTVTVDQTPSNSRGPDTSIVIAAVCNIVLSVMFWHWIGDTIISMGLAIGLFLKSLGINHPPGGLRI